eukprot:1136475-Pelagomonas_calceolata.AAC.2
MVTAFPIQILSNTWGMTRDERLNLSTAAEATLKPCTAGTYRVETFTVHQIGCMRSSGFQKHMLSQQECMSARYGQSLLTAGHKNGQPTAEVDSKRFAEPFWGENHYTTLEHSSRLWH